MSDYSKPTPHAWQLFHWAGHEAHQLSADYEAQRQLRRQSPEEEPDG
jgi:hypothetical protein